MPLKHLLDSRIIERAQEFAETDLSSFLLDMFLGETCNLKCKHCYFGDHNITGHTLNYEDWARIIDAFYECGCRHFHISGKESLLTHHTLKVLDYLGFKKAQDNNIFYGLISNGTSVTTDQYNNIIASPIDYLEFSLDGDEINNDYIRGQGSYRKVFNTIKELQSTNKISISYTINQLNHTDLKTVLAKLYRLNINKFYCSPMQYKGRAKDGEIQIIEPHTYIEVIEQIKALLGQQAYKNVHFRFSMPDIYVKYMLETSTYIEQIEEHFKTGKIIYWKIGSNIVELSLHMLSIPLYRQASITSSGRILISSDSINQHEDNSVYTNIKDFIAQRKLSILNYFISNYESI